MLFRSLSLDVHVSHHGREALTGIIHAAWASAGRPHGPNPETPLVSSTEVAATPFELSEPRTLTVPPPGAPARLLIWLTDGSGAVRARTFVDAAPIEPPNRRGARIRA